MAPSHHHLASVVSLRRRFPPPHFRLVVLFVVVFFPETGHNPVPLSGTGAIFQRKGPETSNTAYGGLKASGIIRILPSYVLNLLPCIIVVQSQYTVDYACVHWVIHLKRTGLTRNQYLALI